MRNTFLLLALLATACVEPPKASPPVSVVRPQPQTPEGNFSGKLGGVVITFSGVSGNTLEASAKTIPVGQGLTGQNFSAQNLSAQGLSSASGLTFTGISQNSFTQGSRTSGTGVRYLTATFRVTPAIELQNLSFVAQVKAGSTLFDTAVLGLKKFDGSGYASGDAQTIARSVRPVHAPLPSGLGLLVNTNNADFQVWSEAELNTYTPSSGSYLLPYGFVARSETGGRALADVAPGVVTFAVKLPLRAKAKDDPFSFSMYFEAVTDSETRVTQSLEETDSGVGAAARAAQAGAKTVVNLMPGVPYTQSVPARVVCNVRTAGPVDNVLERLFPATFSLVFKTPAPNSESVASGSAFNLGFSAPPSGISSENLQLHSPWRGLLPASYATAGSGVTVTPSKALLPGETVELNATTGLNLCQPANFRVRGVSAAGKAIFDQDAGIPTTFGSGTALASGDFTGDSSLDLLAFGFGNQARLFVGNGAGGFVGGATLPALGGGTALDVTTGDFNNDGKLDFAILAPGPRVFLGDGAGGFTAQTPADLLYNAVSGIVSGDLNGDGKLDLAVSILTNSSTASGITVFMGVGNGTFLPGTAHLQNTRLASFANTALVSGDFDGDGLLDLAYGNSLSPNAHQVSVMLGQGGGTFSGFQSYPTVHEVASMVSGDFNNDGRLDLMAAGRGTPALSVALGKADGIFEAGRPISGLLIFNPGPLRVGDFNGDGTLDLAATAASNLNGVNMLLGVGDGSFDPSVFYGATAGPANGIASGDFNNDGQLDLALNTTPSQNVTPTVPSSVFVLLNSGFGKALDFGNGTAAVTVPSSVALTNASDASYSVSAWIKVPSSLPSSGDGLFRILTKNPNVPTNTSPIPFSIFIQNGKLGVALCANTSGCTPFTLRSSKLVNDDGWHHIVFVRDTASTNGRKDRLNVDGTSETVVGNDTITTSLSSNQPLRMGASSGDPGFGGQIDEVKIWNNAQNINGVLADMGPFRAPYSPNLVAYYKLDSVSGGLTPDEIRFGSSGNLTQFPEGNPLVDRP